MGIDTIKLVSCTWVSREEQCPVVLVEVSIEVVLASCLFERHGLEGKHEDGNTYRENIEFFR